MFPIAPFLAVVLQSTAFTLDKVVLSMRGVTYKLYNSFSFVLFFLTALGMFMVVRPPFTTQLLAGWNGPLVALAVFFTIGVNILYYRALDNDALGELQAIDLLRNIPIIFLSSVLFPAERNVVVIGAALLASVAVIWSHWKHHHFVIARRTIPFLIWVLVMSPIAVAVQRELLDTWHPISLLLVENGVGMVFFMFLYSHSIHKISREVFGLLFLLNIMSAFAFVLHYTSYQQFGVVYTVLIFSLQPMLIYVASLLFLKERFEWKKSLAFLVVLATVAFASLSKIL